MIICVGDADTTKTVVATRKPDTQDQIGAEIAAFARFAVLAAHQIFRVSTMLALDAALARFAIVAAQ